MAEARSFDWRVLRVVALVFLAVRLVLFVAARPFMDETYYWLWGQHPALSYFDHPPLVGWTEGLFSVLGWTTLGGPGAATASAARLGGAGHTHLGLLPHDRAELAQRGAQALGRGPAVAPRRLVRHLALQALKALEELEHLGHAGGAGCRYSSKWRGGGRGQISFLNKMRQMACVAGKRRQRLCWARARAHLSGAPECLGGAAA